MGRRAKPAKIQAVAKRPPVRSQRTTSLVEVQAARPLVGQDFLRAVASSLRKYYLPGGPGAPRVENQANQPTDPPPRSWVFPVPGAASTEGGSNLSAPDQPGRTPVLDPGAVEAILVTLQDGGVPVTMENGRLVHPPSAPVPARRRRRLSRRTTWLEAFLAEEETGLLRYFELRDRLARSPRGSVADLSLPISPANAGEPTIGAVANAKVSRVSFRQEKRRLAAMQRLADAGIPESLLNSQDVAIDDLPIDETEKELLRVGMGFSSLPSPRDGDREGLRSAEIVSRLLKGRLAEHPAVNRFFDLYWRGYTAGLTSLVASTGVGASLADLRRKHAVGNRDALGLALATIEADGPIEDPAAIRQRWVREAIMAVARKVIPMTGRGGTTSRSPDEHKAARRESVAISKAVLRLEAKYKEEMRHAETADDARQLVEEKFLKKPRVKDPDRLKHIIREFRRRLKEEGRTVSQ